MQIELRHLSLVLLLAESGSVRKSAGALQVSQAALDAQLRRIERVVGGALFTRAGDTVWPTELGRHFVARAGEVVDGFAALRRRAAELARRAEPEPRRIGAVRAVFVIELIDAVHAIWPGQPLSVRDGSTADILAALADDGPHAVDLAVLVGYPGFEVTPPDGVRARPIVTGEPAFVALPERHPLTGRAEIELAELAEADWIIGATDDQCGRQAAFRLACAEAGFVPNIRYDVADPAAIGHLIRTGRGIGLADRPLPPTGVVCRPLAGSSLSRDLVFCWRAQSPVAEQAESLFGDLVRAYRPQAGEGTAKAPSPA